MLYSFQTMGLLSETTMRVQLTDTSQLLTVIIETALGSTLSWRKIFSATISCESNDCRVAFGVDASTTVGHIIAAGQSMRIPSNSMILAARFINKTSGSNAVIQITLEAQ